MGPWWPCGHVMTCHDQVSSVSYYKRCNEQQTNVSSSNHVNQPFTQFLVMSWLWESGSTLLTIQEFRNTFQIVSSHRQKRKAKKKLSSDPTQLNPNERNSISPHQRFVLIIPLSCTRGSGEGEMPRCWEDAGSSGRIEEELDPGIWPRMQIELVS